MLRLRIRRAPVPLRLRHTPARKKPAYSAVFRSCGAWRNLRVTSATRPLRPLGVLRLRSGGRGFRRHLAYWLGCPHSRGVGSVSRETPCGVSCTLRRALCPRWGQIPGPSGAGGKKGTKPPNTNRRPRPSAVPLWARVPGVASNVNKNLLSA